LFFSLLFQIGLMIKQILTFQFGEQGVEGNVQHYLHWKDAVLADG